MMWCGSLKGHGLLSILSMARPVAAPFTDVRTWCIGPHVIGPYAYSKRLHGCAQAMGYPSTQWLNRTAAPCGSALHGCVQEVHKTLRTYSPQMRAHSPWHSTCSPPPTHMVHMDRTCTCTRAHTHTHTGSTHARPIPASLTEAAIGPMSKPYTSCGWSVGQLVG